MFCPLFSFFLLRCAANTAIASGTEDFGLAKISSCSSFPCLGGGTCQPLGVESFVCICPAERTGSLCERALSQSGEWEENITTTLGCF
jgi:hypothetical protein